MSGTEVVKRALTDLMARDVTGLLDSGEEEQARAVMKIAGMSKTNMDKTIKEHDQMTEQNDVRVWEKRDIVDILIDHHKALVAKALELGGNHEEFAQTEWDAIAIEHYLGTDHGMEWDGEKFQMGENPYTVDKYCPTTKEEKGQ